MTIDEAIKTTVDLIKEVSDTMKNYSNRTFETSQQRLLEHHISLEKIRAGILTDSKKTRSKIELK